MAFIAFDSAPQESGFVDFDKPPDPNAPGDTTRGFKTGWGQAIPTLKGAVGLLGATAEKAVGEGGYATKIKEWGLHGFQEGMDKLQPLAHENDDVTVAWDKAKSGDVGALVDWAQYAFGYGIAQMAQTAAVGMASGAVGGAMSGGIAAAPAALAGVVEQSAAKGLIRSLVEKAIAKRVAAGETAEAATKSIAQNIGAVGGLSASSIAQEAGQIYPAAEEQARKDGRSLTGSDLARIWGASTVAGASETAGDVLGLGAVMGRFKGITDKLGATRLTRAAAGAAGGAALEAGQEGFQTVAEHYGAGQPIADDAGIKDIINSMAMAAVPGAAFGGAYGAASRARPAATAPAAAQVDIPTPPADAGPTRTDAEATASILAPAASIDDTIKAASAAVDEPSGEALTDADKRFMAEQIRQASAERAAETDAAFKAKELGVVDNPALLGGAEPNQMQLAMRAALEKAGVEVPEPGAAAPEPVIAGRQASSLSAQQLDLYSRSGPFQAQAWKEIERRALEAQAAPAPAAAASQSAGATVSSEPSTAVAPAAVAPAVTGGQANAIQKQSADAGSVQRGAGQGNAGQSQTVGQGNAQHQETPGTQAAARQGADQLAVAASTASAAPPVATTAAPAQPAPATPAVQLSREQFTASAKVRRNSKGTVVRIADAEPIVLRGFPPKKQAIDRAYKAYAAMFPAPVSVAPTPKPGPPATPSNDPLIRWILGKGGIDARAALDIWGEKSFKSNARVRGLFRAQVKSRAGVVHSGRGIDDLAQQAAAEGFLTAAEANDVDGGVQALKDRINAALHGERQTQMGGGENAQFEAMRAAHDAFLPNELEAAGLAELSEQEQNEALLAAVSASDELRGLTDAERDAKLAEYSAPPLGERADASALAEGAQGGRQPGEDAGEEAVAAQRRPVYNAAQGGFDLTPAAEPAKPEQPYGDTDATLARFKPRQLVEFSKPYVGKTGAKLVGYEWTWRPEAIVDRRGEDRTIRISDWERAVTNPETNRDIVHQFHVSTDDGVQVVSAETAAKLLGVAQSTVRTSAVRLLEQEIRQREADARAKREADSFDAMDAQPTPALAIEKGVATFAPFVVNRAQTKDRLWGQEQDRLSREMLGEREERFMVRDGKYIFSPGPMNMAEAEKRGWRLVDIRRDRVWDENGNDKMARTPIALTGQTADEARAEAERAASAKAADEAKQRAADEKARKVREAEEIKQRSTAAAGDFTLGATEAVSAKEQKAIDAKAATDQLAGQGDIFSRPANTLSAADALRLAAAKIEEEAKPAKPVVSQGGGIGDFGEKIGGARKDYAEAYRDRMKEAADMDVAAEPLSKSWPEPDYQKLLDGGADAWSVAFAHAARDEVPTKPTKAWRLVGWVKQVQLLRDVTNKIMSGEISAADARRALSDKQGLQAVADRAELYTVVGHDKSLKGVRISSGSYSMYNRVEFKPPKVIWTVEGKTKTTAMSRWPKEFAHGDTRAEAIANFKTAWSAVPAEQEAKAVEFDIYSRRGENAFFIGKKIGKEVVTLKDGFATAKEARQWKVEHQTELMATLQKFREVPNERRESNSPRVGEDHRNDADVTPAQFGEAFGFRGVEFGNYVEDAKRQADLNEAYDALMDLAGVLDIPPKALALNGELGLAFGARGKGGRTAGGRGAAAHYEPDYIVINLTKEHGAGSLAHEWFHAVDNYFSRARGEAAAFLTERPGVRGEGVRPEMVAAFKRVMDTISASGVRERSRKLDKARSSPYWGTNLEMAARSFESYIIAKLHDQGASNDYLANIVSQQYWDAAAALGMEKEGTYPYPADADKPAIRAAFDDFFKTVETRETDKGVALFSRRSAEPLAPVQTAEARTGLPMIGNRDVVLANPTLATHNGSRKVVDFKLRRPDKTFIGDLQLELSPGKVEALNWIGVPEHLQRTGIGESVVRAILAYNKGESFKLDKVLTDSPKAVEFWRGLGAQFDETKRSPTGIVTLAGYERSGEGRGAGTERLATDSGGGTGGPRSSRSAESNASALEPSNRRSAEAPSRGLSVGAIEKLVAPFDRKLTVPIQVFASAEEASQAARAHVYDDAKAFYYRGMIYIVAPNITDAADLERAVWHEITHAGIHADLGTAESREYRRALATVALNPNLRAEAAKWRTQFGADYQASMREANPDITDKQIEDRTRLLAWEEALAKISESGKPINGIQRLVGALQKLLRSIGFERLANFMEGKSNAEVMQLIGQAREAVMRGEPQAAGEQAPAFNRSGQAPEVLLRQYFASPDARPVHVAISSDGGVITWSTRRKAVEAELDRRSNDPAIAGARIERVTPKNIDEIVGSPDIRFSRAGTLPASEPPPSTEHLPTWAEGFTDAQKDSLRKAGVIFQTQTLKERARGLVQDFGKKFTQGVLDQFAPLKELDQQAYMKARLSKATDGGVEALMLYGKPFLRDGAIDVNTDNGGFLKTLRGLKNEHDRFFAWVAGQRALQLKAQGKENLLTDEDLSFLTKLNAADEKWKERPQAFADALGKLRAYNKSVMDIAEQQGIIDAETRPLWESQFYVPFYRVMEDCVTGPTIKSGLVRQYAFKKLKGGTENLNDLIKNTLMNWSHLLSAAQKNAAAKASILAAERVGIAQEVPADTKDAVWYLENGAKKHYLIDDPYVMDAITAIEQANFGPWMKPMAAVKRWLTMGVTANPAFKIRNLIRDSIAAIGQNEVSYNVWKNIEQGWKGTAEGSQTRASLMAGGGMFRFGTMLEGDRAQHLKRLIEAGVDEGTVLDTSEKVKAMFQKAWDAYQEFGDRSENINRAALYEQMIAAGKTHLEASYLARDMLDFGMSGKWAAVRFLTQTVPFMNARLQGLYKLGRGVAENPARAGYVTGAVALASLALLMGYEDDDDWKKRDDWDRDSYWWFRFGGTAWRIPKPFELGAIGTIAERTYELAFNKEMSGKRFTQRMADIVSQNFAMSPVPQLVKPLVDLYANQDSFTGRQIEGMGMERLRKQDRYTAATSYAARFVGMLGLPDPLQLAQGRYEGISPAQADFLIRGYFGWLGTMVSTAADYGIRPIVGAPAKPAMQLRDVFLAGNFVESLPTNQSRYVTDLYQQATEIEAAYGSWKQALKQGEPERAREIFDAEREKIGKYKLVEAVKRKESEISAKVRRIETSTTMDADTKRRLLDLLANQKDLLARRVTAASR